MGNFNLFKFRKLRYIPMGCGLSFCFAFTERASQWDVMSLHLINPVGIYIR